MKALLTLLLTNHIGYFILAKNVTIWCLNVVKKNIYMCNSILSSFIKSDIYLDVCCV